MPVEIVYILKCIFLLKLFYVYLFVSKFFSILKN